MLARLGIAQAVKGEIGGETVHAEHAHIRAERQSRWNDAAQHSVWRGDAIALPTEPAVDELACAELGCVAFNDLTKGERAHRRIQRNGCAVVPLVIGPSALRRIDGDIAILNQDLAVADSCLRLRQGKGLGLRYPLRPRHEPDLAVFKKGHARSHN